jgi:hypothetical protein
MTQPTPTATIDRETLELVRLKLPEQINGNNMAQIMADLERLLAPGIGVMLDFSQTTAIERGCIKGFEFANELAQGRSATLGYMGESAQLRTLLESNQFFRDSSSPS